MILKRIWLWGIVGMAIKVECERCGITHRIRSLHRSIIDGKSVCFLCYGKEIRKDKEYQLKLEKEKEENETNLYN